MVQYNDKNRRSAARQWNGIIHKSIIVTWLEQDHSQPPSYRVCYTAMVTATPFSDNIQPSKIQYNGKQISKSGRDTIKPYNTASGTENKPIRAQ